MVLFFLERSIPSLGLLSGNLIKSLRAPFARSLEA
jgi:hypothetical protein